MTGEPLERLRARVIALHRLGYDEHRIAQELDWSVAGVRLVLDRARREAIAAASAKRRNPCSR